MGDCINRGSKVTQLWLPLVLDDYSCLVEPGFTPVAGLLNKPTVSIERHSMTWHPFSVASGVLSRFVVGCAAESFEAEQARRCHVSSHTH